MDFEDEYFFLLIFVELLFPFVGMSAWLLMTEADLETTHNLQIHVKCPIEADRSSWHQFIQKRIIIFKNKFKAFLAALTG